MKSTLLYAFSVALMVVGGACGSNSGESTGTGGTSGSGGTSSAGGSNASGGSGADEGSGGKAGSGGSQESGGAQGSGGKQGEGGTQAAGGEQGSGGSEGSGGATARDAGGDVAAKADASLADTAAPKDTQGSKSDTQGNEGLRERQIKVGELTFDALEAGPSDGEPVLLLHGFPEISAEWTALMTVLAANGYHCLAPDQRGYSPGARPTEVDAYKYAELVADGFAFGKELGEKFHVVAHDWGANIAWLMLQKDPSPIASFTSVAVPHYQVWAKAVYNDPDMAGYLTMLTTWNTPDKGEAFWTESKLRTMFKQAKKPNDLIDATVEHMMEPGCMTAALNWYRASDAQKSVVDDYEPWKVAVPTLLIFGTTDIGQKTVEDTKPLMTGPFEIVQPVGGHFMVDEQPEAVADATLAHLKKYPIK